MAHTINTTAQWAADRSNEKSKANIYDRFMAYADTQADSKTLWFMVSLIAQGVLFLPVPAVLMFYFGAPIYVLVVTLTLFFANVIAGMGGNGIRTLMSLFAASIIIHLLMLIIFII